MAIRVGELTERPIGASTSPDSPSTVPSTEGPVGTGHLTGRQLGHQRLVGAGRAGHHHEARRPPVESVHDPGTVGFGADRRRQPRQLGVPGHQSVDQGARTVPGPGMDDQPGRLVDHDHLGVLVDDHDLDGRVPHRPVGLDLVRTVDVEGLALAQCVLRLVTTVAVDA